MLQQKKELLSTVTEFPTKNAATYVASQLLRKEVLTKQEAMWLTGIPLSTWDRYAKYKKQGRPGFENFPETGKPGGTKMSRCRYKTPDVVRWMDNWDSWRARID